MRYLQKVWKWLFGIIVVLIFCLPVVFLLAGSLKGTKELTDSLGAGDSRKRRRLTVELLSCISNTSPLREGFA